MIMKIPKQKPRKASTGIALRKLAAAMQSKEGTSNKQELLLSYKALRYLRSDRPKIIFAFQFIWFLNRLPASKLTKLNLWMAISNPRKLINQINTDKLKSSLKETSAWLHAKQELSQSSWNYKSRLSESEALINTIKEYRHERLFILHHYDCNGYFPFSWQSALEELRQLDWKVIVSSSNLSKNSIQSLRERNIIISFRQNIGRCLGAYKDFIQLLNSQKELKNSFNQIILANDSSIPIGGPAKFGRYIESVSQKLNDNEPLMIGATDSVQESIYHIQSYLIGVNYQLLQNKNWSQFWANLPITDNKRQLILDGEFGLSQSMQKAGINIQAMHSVINVILEHSDIPQELTSYGVHEPTQLNPSIHAWKNLLAAGCPLIKKQLLFEIAHIPIPLSELGNKLSIYDSELIEDLKELIKTRFSGCHGLSNHSI